MSCNCNPIIPCIKCQQGVPCNCPPSYPVPNTTVPCTCCPNGYALTTSPNFVTPTNPTGQVCFMNTSAGKVFIATIPCVPCEEITTTDCVQYSGIIPIQCGIAPGNIYGIIPGDSLTTIISKMCITNEDVLEAMLTAIGNSSRALAGFCNLVQNCGSLPGTTTPIIGTISFTIP